MISCGHSWAAGRRIIDYLKLVLEPLIFSLQLLESVLGIHHILRRGIQSG
jgi:hypothetical protein